VNVPVLESLFLNRRPLPESRDLQRVLVLGGDHAGRELAIRLKDEGFDVLLLEDGDGAAASDGISLFSNATLGRVQGFVGDFDVVIDAADGPFKERVGFIVAAQPAEHLPKYRDYGLARSERVIALSDLEAALETGDALVQPMGPWMHAVFLCGLKGGSDPAEFARVLNAVGELGKRSRVQAYVFTRQVKVAGPGLERRYREARESGTLFFKFDGPGPVFEEGPDGPVMIFNDPLLGTEMELAPDLLIVDEEVLPPSSLEPLMDAIPSSEVARPFLQPESIRFSGVETPKAGILAVGPARGKFGTESIVGDMECAVTALKTWRQGWTDRGLPGPPEVDQARCAVCLTCVRLCPHGAMSFRKRAEADPASCVRCGICAVECPAAAISLAPPDGDTSPAVKITNGVSAGREPNKIVAFLCSRSAAQALESAAATVRENLAPVVVPCAGTIDIAHILAAFREGAAGILAAGCHTGNCASIYGTVLAAERAARARAVLEEIGIDPGRVLFTTLAGNTPGDLARTVRELEDRLSNGPN